MLVAVSRSGAPEGPSWAVLLPALLLPSLSHDDPVLLSGSMLVLTKSHCHWPSHPGPASRQPWTGAGGVALG